MNKYLFNASKITLCALIIMNCASYATPEQELCATVLNTTHSHFRTKAITWSNDFLYSNKPFKSLLEQFKGHHVSFNQEVISRLYTRSATEKGDLTLQTQILIKEINDMIVDMKNGLSSLVGCTSTITFMAKMNKAQTDMSAHLNKIESKIKRFKQVCDEQQAPKLRTSVDNLEKAISDFRKSNSNVTSALLKRIPAFIAENGK